MYHYCVVKILCLIFWLPCRKTNMRISLWMEWCHRKICSLSLCFLFTLFYFHSISIVISNFIYFWWLPLSFWFASLSILTVDLDSLWSIKLWIFDENKLSALSKQKQIEYQIKWESSTIYEPKRRRKKRATISFGNWNIVCLFSLFSFVLSLILPSISFPPVTIWFYRTIDACQFFLLNPVSKISLKMMIIMMEARHSNFFFLVDNSRSPKVVNAPKWTHSSFNQVYLCFG